jgi:hypothetical protein
VPSLGPCVSDLNGRVTDRPATSCHDSAPELGLGYRGRHLYRAFRTLIDRSMLVAAGALLRTVLDVAIIIRWIEANPDLHVKMWFGEDARQSRLLMEAVIELHRRRGRTLE